MNREIKFRAWDKKRKAFFPMSPCFNSASQSVSITTGYLPRHENASHNDVRDSGNFEFCQYTGLKDKNGKEIFEGDVVEIRKDGKIFDEASRVIFSQYGGFQFYDMTFQDVFRDSNYDVRIIGNVFENPALLK